MKEKYLLILGGPIHGDQPKDILFQRIKTGAEFLKEHPDYKVVVSGGLTSKTRDITEAEIMSRVLKEMGIDEGRIILESNAMTTLQNFQFTKDIVGEDADVTFVTSEFHIWRSKKIMEKAGVSYKSISAPNGKHSLGFRIREAFLRPLAAVGIIW